MKTRKRNAFEEQLNAGCIGKLSNVSSFCNEARETHRMTHFPLDDVTRSQSQYSSSSLSENGCEPEVELLALEMEVTGAKSLDQASADNVQTVVSRQVSKPVVEEEAVSHFDVPTVGHEVTVLSWNENGMSSQPDTTIQRTLRILLCNL